MFGVALLPITKVYAEASFNLLTPSGNHIFCKTVTIDPETTHDICYLWNTTDHTNNHRQPQFEMKSIQN